MAHRTQITLTDAQYAFLNRGSERTGMPLAELVRRALESTYGTPGRGTTRALRQSFGAWRGRDFTGAAYVDRLRRGMGRRLADP